MGQLSEGQGALRRSVAKRLPLGEAAAGEVDEALGRITGVLGAVLDLAAISSGEVRLKLEPADVTALTKQEVRKVNRALRSEGHGVRAALSGTGEGLARIDHARFLRCIRTLLDFAAASCVPNEVIRVGLHTEPHDEGQLAIRVLVDLPGFSSAEAADLFRPAPSEARLPLAVCSVLARSMGGHAAAATLPSGQAALCFELIAEAAEMEPDETYPVSAAFAS